ncbi:GGDEF domain-containing protein [Geomonas sp. RF6]|uniref:GGDEF domain-containing protein n=1 Tax=Geomonas sp. RF6 TaxID=2897342 RepID=UPI001E3F698A|nr:GGDEF domain-containing protein [Geomonas sp. RF6]UFS71805.1 GGDEF domain-containing protein [Geomonas sp. RF6]
MIPDQSWAKDEVQARYSGYHKTFGTVSYLLVTLALLDLAVSPLSGSEAGVPCVCCAILLAYYWGTGLMRITPENGRSRTLLDLFVLLFFVTGICSFTGKTASPFYPLNYLILMAGALTQGARSSYLLAAFSISCCAILAATEGDDAARTLVGHLPEFVSFALITHLGALLAGEAGRARREVERLSLTDDLTSLHNMRSFHALAEQQEKMAKRYSKAFAICMLDSDNLKRINDRFGHMAGTELIKWTARIIEKNIRECDVAARFGGDEFIILYSEHDKHQIFPAVERIVHAMATTPFFFEGHRLTCTVSAGLASFPEDGSSLKEVMANADIAVYQSKERGKNQATMYGSALPHEVARRRAGAIVSAGTTTDVRFEERSSALE